MAADIEDEFDAPASTGEIPALVERARSGEEPAWEQLSRRSYPRRIAYAPLAAPPNPARTSPDGGCFVRRPDVALISPYPTPDQQEEGGATALRQSGVAQYTSRLAASLEREGLSVTVLAPMEPGAPPLAKSGGVTVQRCYRRGARALQGASDAARRCRARVVHVQHETFLYGGPSSLSGIGPALTALRRGRQGPVVTMHQVVDPADVDAEFTRLHRVSVPVPAARAALRYVQRSIQRHAAMTVVHERAFGTQIEGATVIPLGVGQLVRYPRPDAKHFLGLPTFPLTVLCFGYLAPYKGYEAAIEAAHLAGPEVQLVIAGGDHPRLAGRDRYGEDLREQFGAVARFVGYVPEAEVATWYSAADVVLLPYPRPFASSGPFALALAAGTPPLCSPALGACLDVPPELVAPIEPDGLAAVLRELAHDRARLGRAEAATAAMAAGRSWAEVARRHIGLYQEVIDAAYLADDPGRARRALGGV